MRIISTIIFLLLANNLFAQSHNEKSDLRIKIDSIIEFQIEYKIDSTTNKYPVRKWDSTKKRGLYPSFSSFPPNPMTLIILDSQPIELDELNKYDISKIEISQVYYKNDVTATALYGTRARNGLIILKSKK